MKKGFTLLELVVYIGIFAAVSVVFVSSILQMTKVYGLSRTDRLVTTAAETSLERIVREVRLAAGIDCLSGTTCAAPPAGSYVPAVGTSGSCIQLLSYKEDIYQSGATPTVIYKKICYDSATKKILFDNDSSSAGDDQSLTPAGVSVTNLTFRPLDPTSASKAAGIQIEMTITGGSGSRLVSRSLHAIAVLRGDY